MTKQVQTAESVSAQATEIRNRSLKIAQAEVATGELWFDLCAYARKNKVPEDIVRKEMSNVGFIKQRVSEVIRVISAPQALWDKYETRLFGFRRTLQLARKNEFTQELEATPAGVIAVTRLMPAMSGSSTSRTEDGTRSDPQEVAVQIEKASDDLDGDSKPKATPKAKMQRAAAAIFKLAKKPGEWKSGDGWVLILVKEKAVRKAEKRNETKP